jgi:hypothetical protein
MYGFRHIGDVGDLFKDGRLFRKNRGRQEREGTSPGTADSHTAAEPFAPFDDQLAHG